MAAEHLQSQSDALAAFRNAIKLGGSLLLTLGIGFVLRPMMGRLLGPSAFGQINFAEALTATAFVLTALGVDTYIRKEVSVRPAHASEFFAGITFIRVFLALVLFAGLQLFLMLTHRPRETWLVVHLYGLAAFLLTLNQSFAALLHANSNVNGLSLLNVVTKLVWAGGMTAALLLQWPLWAIATVVLVSEGLKTMVSLWLVEHHLKLKWVIDWLPVKAALLASLPIFLNVAAHTIYNKLDVSILALVAGDREVGWYSASSWFAGMALLITPMIGWVLLPLFARAQARSEEEYTQVMRRSLELVLAIAFPTSLIVFLGAEEWLVLFTGPQFAPAAGSLKMLSSIFVLTYVAMLSSNALILTGRAWAQAAISISGLIVNPLLNWLFIAKAMAYFGEGGAGIGAAAAQLGTEIVVTSVMTSLIGKRAFDRRSVLMVVKTLAVVAATVVLDAWLHSKPMPGLVRVGLDMVFYAALVVAVRAVHVGETIQFARSAFARSKKETT